MLQEKQFIDESFLAAAPLIAGGDPFVLQHLLSMIFWNVTREQAPPGDDVQAASPEVLARNALQDGVTLPKLLAAIDPDFVSVEWLFVDPQTEIERKWNVRKAYEALRKKPAWPESIDIDPLLLFIGERTPVEQLCEGIIACFPGKFGSPAAVRALKDALGLAPVA
jgi:hypothetical protein